MWFMPLIATCRFAEKRSEDTEENQFTLLNSFWYLIATMFQQKTELTPRQVT